MLETRLKGLIFSSELHKALYLKNVRPPPCQVHTVFEICESAAAAARPEF